MTTVPSITRTTTLAARSSPAPNGLRVGWVGLGDQGAPMARAIATAGFDLQVWVRREASLNELEGLPHTRHESLADLGGASEILGLCLREDSDIEEVLIAGGLLAAMEPGTVLINHGTGLPGYASSLADRAARTGVLVLDAPVSGGRAGAEARRLTTIVGGPEPALAKARPVLDSFSTTIAYMGAVGSGQIGKLINNALLMMNQRSIQDILVLARNLGLDLDRLVDLLLSGTGRSFAVEALTGPVTAANAAHLEVLQAIDMDIFTEAMTALGQDVAQLDAYARSGAHGLPMAAELLAEGLESGPGRSRSVGLRR